MSSILNQQFVATTAQANFDPIILEFIDGLQHEGISEHYITGHHQGSARHFLTWLARSGISLGAVDGSVIDRFLQHDCDCCSTASVPGTGRWLRPWRKRKTSPEIMRFVRFLEQTERIKTPRALDDNFRLLEDFLERLRSGGYASETIKKYRNACAGLIVWLHLSRIPLHDLTPEAYERFWSRQFICSIPGVFHGRRASSPGSSCDMMIREFFGYLVSIGQIEPLEPAPKEKALPRILERYFVWLERNRGICGKTINDHIRLIAAVLPDLGDDPGGYDAALIKRVLWEQMEHRTREHAQKMTISMRMYLRFLVSEGSIVAALVEAVPTMPRWRLSTLPRYISTDELERTIESCGNHHTGIRDRAILLLLARLALRAGDIAALRLCDIDWDRAGIRVSGKSKRETALPLPQDAGDALHTYIATVRPRVANEQRVFLRAMAPYQPFSGSSAVSKVTRRALERARVTTFAGRGAHVFRHSQATALLRSGATLDVIQALLRHDSLNTTMIYAKTDVLMLQEVAQPWIGGVEK